jgi:hypothetical protein
MAKYWNGQLFQECQLVTLWNAAIYHGTEVPKRYGSEYVADSLFANAIEDGAEYTGHVVDKLGLKPKEGPMSWNWIRKNLPVEFSINYRGYHSALAIDTNNKGEILFANYSRTRLQWVKYSKIKEMQEPSEPLVSWKLKGKK